MYYPGPSRPAVMTNFSSCVNFSRKQCVSLQNLCRNRNLTQLYGKLKHIDSPKLLNFYIFISISTKKGTNKFMLKFALLYLQRKQSQCAHFQCVKKSGHVNLLTYFMSVTAMDTFTDMCTKSNALQHFVTSESTSLQGQDLLQRKQPKSSVVGLMGQK